MQAVNENKINIVNLVLAKIKELEVMMMENQIILDSNSILGRWFVKNKYRTTLAVKKFLSILLAEEGNYQGVIKYLFNNCYSSYVDSSLFENNTIMNFVIRSDDLVLIEKFIKLIESTNIGIRIRKSNIMS